MLYVEIKTWQYEGERFQITAYADHDRKLYPVNICTAGGFSDRAAALVAARDWLNKEHPGNWHQIS